MPAGAFIRRTSMTEFLSLLILSARALELALAGKNLSVRFSTHRPNGYSEFLILDIEKFFISP